MEIKKSNDYSQFVMLTGNRPINQKKVDKIVSDIKNGFNMLPYFPILVKSQGESFAIIDGQHRYEASVKSEEPVYYILGEDITLKQIAQLNSRGEKWKPSDYINCYIKLGVEDYKVLNEILTRFKVPTYAAISLLMYNKVKSGAHAELQELFFSGEFKVNFYHETVELLELVDLLFSRYTFSNDRSLIEAVQKIKEGGKCDFDELEEKIQQSPMSMDRQSTVKSYIYNIERVYNYKRQMRKVIY